MIVEQLKMIFKMIQKMIKYKNLNKLKHVQIDDDDVSSSSQITQTNLLIQFLCFSFFKNLKRNFSILVKYHSYSFYFQYSSLFFKFNEEAKN